jgi:NADP-dependent 3-hydroxy acid dehydrogenase YdfG
MQLINNAGYFKQGVEKLDCMDYDDELKTINIAAIGPLRITAALLNGGLLQARSKIIMITSQGGSVSWRTVQNPTGGDYGHHVRTHTSARRLAANSIHRMMHARLQGVDCLPTP